MLVIVLPAIPVSAEVILTLDLSVANQVTISSTGANAPVDDGDRLDDIYFENFYNRADIQFGTRLDFANDGTNLTTFDPNLGIEPAADYAFFSRDGGNDPGLHLGYWTTYSSIDFSTTRPAGFLLLVFGVLVSFGRIRPMV